MRISDWSSDVCSSDLPGWSETRICAQLNCAEELPASAALRMYSSAFSLSRSTCRPAISRRAYRKDRKSVVEGTSVSVRVDLGGRRIIKKKIKHSLQHGRSRRITQIIDLNN